mmetsp:Transcript_40848/g.79940  ORF Transcript_40848/g.79940 Transcript_40848/m.79940 type:complete len:269 (+) Transcript_40848:21-827(+)
MLTSEALAAPKTITPEETHRSATLPWGLAFVSAYLLVIAFGIVSSLSLQATYTVTIHSWFLGWLLSYRRYGLKDRWVLMEAPILLCSLFQLAVGAFAFSRIYYGPWIGHTQDLFQELSVLYLHDYEHVIPVPLAEWWVTSSRLRFSGLGWYLCEIADVVVHQGPFVYMCRILSRDKRGRFGIGNDWSAVSASIVGIRLPLCAAAGVLHRLAWDYATCGEIFCDGPYRGFTKRIRNHEQFFWHAVPSVVLLAYIMATRRGHLIKIAKIC